VGTELHLVGDLLLVRKGFFVDKKEDFIRYKNALKCGVI
jgi:hypothetical protein